MSPEPHGSPHFAPSIISQTNIMIVILKSGRTELIKAPQDPERAWNLADRLTRRTGILHWVGRV